METPVLFADFASYMDAILRTVVYGFIAGTLLNWLDASKFDDPS